MRSRMQCTSSFVIEIIGDYPHFEGRTINPFGLSCRKLHSAILRVRDHISTIGALTLAIAMYVRAGPQSLLYRNEVHKLPLTFLPFIISTCRLGISCYLDFFAHDLMQKKINPPQVLRISSLFNFCFVSSQLSSLNPV